MRKFWIAMDKKNNRVLFTNESKQKVVDWTKSFLEDSPGRNPLTILEATDEVRLTAAPSEVKPILSSDEALEKMKKDTDELIQHLKSSVSAEVDTERAASAEEEVHLEEPKGQPLSDIWPQREVRIV